MTFIVAIDGAAGTGKGTIARGISKEFNFSYFDTGIIYRGLALKTISKYGKNFIKQDAISEANIFDINSVNDSKKTGLISASFKILLIAFSMASIILPLIN